MKVLLKITNNMTPFVFSIRSQRFYIYFLRPFRIFLGKTIIRARASITTFSSFPISQVVYYRKISQDGFISRHHFDFLASENFIAKINNSSNYIPALGQEKLRNISYRAHIVNWAANQCLDIDGDFLELGTWYGILSKNICEQFDLAQHGKELYLMDTWGDPNRQIHPDPHYQSDIYSEVANRFQTYSFVKLIRGWVPDDMNLIQSEKISFLMIDLNSHEPEKAALAYFWPKLSKGGILYLDDYGHPFPKLRSVVDSFFESRPETILHFANGVALIIKISD